MPISTGLAGSEQALIGGFQGATAGLETGYNQARADFVGQTGAGINALQSGLQGVDAAAGQSLGLLNSAYDEGAGKLQQGIQGFQGFADQGAGAGNVQAALSGALGPEAQAQAFQNYQSSPGFQFALDEAERSSVRNASATGGLGGGRLQQELQRQAIGYAQQDFGNQFNRLGGVADRGMQATGQQGNLLAQQAGLASNLGIAGSNVIQNQGQAGLQTGQNILNARQNLGDSLGNLAQQTVLQGANYAYNTGQNLASGRTRAGEQIAGAIGSTTSSLANLMNQQGAGISDIIGTGASNINQLYQLASQGDAAAKEQLGTILANLAAQQGSQQGSQPIIPGAQSNMLGQLGTIASGVGGLISATSQNSNNASAGSMGPYNSTSGFWQAPSMVN